MKRKALYLFVILAMLVGFLPAALPALAQTTIYVDASNVGDPLEDGSATHPFDMIQEGIDVATSGDTVEVAAGTYDEDIALFADKDGVAVVGAGAGASIINGIDTVDWAVGLIGVGPSTLLEGFTINGYYQPEVFNWGIHVDSGASVVISNCTVTGGSPDTYSSGAIRVYGGASPSIENCTITSPAGASWGMGIHTTNASPFIIDCNISGNITAGIDGYANANATVVNSIISDNGRGVSLGTDCSMNFINCTIYGNTYEGIYSNASSPTIANCILWNNGDDLDNCSATYSDIGDGDGGTGNINADPLFVDAPGGDFHLQTGSPCIDAGNNGAVPGWLTTDFDGQPRIMNAVADMGADEYLSVLVRTTIHVDASNVGDPLEDGSATHPFDMIQEGIGAATSGDTVEVAAGTYKLRT